MKVATIKGSGKPGPCSASGPCGPRPEVERTSYASPCSEPLDMSVGFQADGLRDKLRTIVNLADTIRNAVRAAPQNACDQDVKCHVNDLFNTLAETHVHADAAIGTLNDVIRSLGCQ